MSLYTFDKSSMPMRHHSQKCYPHRCRESTRWTCHDVWDWRGSTVVSMLSPSIFGILNVAICCKPSLRCYYRDYIISISHGVYVYFSFSADSTKLAPNSYIGRLMELVWWSNHGHLIARAIGPRLIWLPHVMQPTMGATIQILALVARASCWCRSFRHR